jgi:hypothetical protein
MPTEIDTLDKVPEAKIKKLMKDFAQDGASMVTVINDGTGTFTVEATFPDGGLHAIVTKSGKMSTFGGPDDTGVTPDEGLSLYDSSEVAANPGLFLAAQPSGTTGLARRLNPQAKYLACRWDFEATPKAFLKTITVKVSANGKSEEAIPVDFGPSMATGRVADLSPGLADALDLDTNDECSLEVPLPEAGLLVGIDLKAIDKVTFPTADMKRTLVAATSSGRAITWVTGLVGTVEAGQTLMRKVGDNEPEVLLNATTVFPVMASDQVSAATAAELNKVLPKNPSNPVEGPDGPKPSAGDDMNAKLFAAAQAFVGTSTRDVPLTDNGNLACAWAINEAVRRAFGKPISADSKGNNGLDTAGLFAALKKHHKEVDSPLAGTIIISPTPPSGNVHGHVGIVGQIPATLNNTKIFSNSSSLAKFAQTHTIKSWKARYIDKLGLDVRFFELNADIF